MATLDSALQQMLGAGMPTPPDGILVADGRRHRYGPKKRAWYVLYEYVARNQKRYIAGAFGYWGLIDSTKIQTDWADVDQEERERLRAAAAGREQREAEKRDRLARFAAQRALAQWNKARARLNDGEAVPYLARKGVSFARGLRMEADGTLLVPMVRYDVTEEQAQDPAYTGPRRLVGLQKIAPDGAKRFNKGMAKEGAACRMGPKPKDGQIILIGEGLATMLSVLEAIEASSPAFVAFDAGNLLPVARIVRALYPKSPIVFVADDDAYLELQLAARLREDFGITEPYVVGSGAREMHGKSGTITVRADLQGDAHNTPVLTAGLTINGALRTLILQNTGRTKAWAAAGALGNAHVIWPWFAERNLRAEPKFTDFNDLQAAEGLDVVREQVAKAMTSIREAAELSRALLEGRPAKDAPAAGGGGAGGKGGGGGGAEAEPNWHLHGALLRRFTQVYPSDEAFDGQLGRLVKVPHMRLMFGSQAVNLWLGSTKKRTVLTDDVVFDPRGIHDPDTTVNLYRGLQMKPAAEKSCEKLLALVHYLCGEDPEDTHTPITSWVLRWAAYPLQNIGAKMATAVVMHGKEGTGKNLFWGAVRAIYGNHGGVISQMQLQSQFNDWLSAKLFLIANEVVTRSEIKHHVGVLKNMVTEDEVWINPKHIGARSEANHCQLVFLSNEFQPLQISPDDRRYMIIKTPEPRNDALYQAVVEEVKAGGAQALYAYLLQLPMEGFTAHAKPVMTEAKLALIEQGMASAQLFWTELHGELLGLPYCPALTKDVYRAYLEWCRRNGERVPQSLNKFKPAFMSLNGVRAKIERVRDPDSSVDLAARSEAEVRQRPVFLMGEPKADPAHERNRIQTGVVAFRKAMKSYLDEESESRGGSADSTPLWARGDSR